MPKNRLIPAIGLMIAVLLSFRSWAQPPAPAAKAPAGPAPAPALAAPALGGPAPAAPADPPKPVPPTEAELFLDEAIKAVTKLESVSADVLQKVDMLGQKFQNKGRYVKAPKDRLYMMLEVVGLADASGTMLQVCDGSTFWEYQKVFETQIYRKLDAGAILAKLRGSELEDSFRQGMMTQLGFAGPDVLLAGLRKTIKFDQKVKDTLDGRPVWVLRGNWTSHEGLLGPNGQQLPPLAPLPSYIPSLVSVYLGADDYWPYKITLAGQPLSVLFEDTRPIGPDGRRVGALKNIQKPLISRIELIYSNVKLNGPIPDTQFAFQAPIGAQVEDRTKDLLDLLERAATLEAAKKKAEAAKSEDQVLDQSIPLPKAAPAGDAPPSIPAQPRTPK